MLKVFQGNHGPKNSYLNKLLIWCLGSIRFYSSYFSHMPSFKRKVHLGLHGNILGLVLDYQRSKICAQMVDVDES